ncbi:hypothetical protein [Azospirillum palustre]
MHAGTLPSTMQSPDAEPECQRSRGEGTAARERLTPPRHRTVAGGVQGLRVVEAFRPVPEARCTGAGPVSAEATPT